MAVFHYKVKDKHGKLISGIVEGNSEKEAAGLLRDQELLVIDIVPAENEFSLRKFIAPIQRVSFGDIVNFTRQLSTMITAGLTLTESLNILQKQTTNPNFSAVINDILHEIEAGNNLASALSKYPQYFSKIYVSLVRAGEAGGMLDQVIARLAENLEKQREFDSQTKGALVYPAIVIIGMIGVVFLMMTMVIPKLTSLYADFDIDLPITTQILMATSSFCVSYWWAIIGGSLGIFFAFRAWKNTPVGARIVETLMFKIPIWGNLQKEIILVEFTRTLGLLVGAGLPILEALNIVSDSLENVIYRDGIKEAAQKVEKGFPLGVPLSQNPNFPPILGQMTKVGEETGKLDESLLKLSRYFETESEQLVKNLTTAIEPLIIIVLGVGVGFLVMSIIMPIYQLTNAF